MDLLHLPLPSDQAPERKERVIVIAHDRTPRSDAMVEKVMRDGYVWPDDKIYLVHVVPQLASAINMLAPEAPAPVPSEAQQHILLTTAQDALLKVAKRLQENSFSNVQCEVFYGDPKWSLADYCREIQPTFVITGTRGYGTLLGSIIGSVSCHLVRTCPCPVMVMRGRDEHS